MLACRVIAREQRYCSAVFLFNPVLSRPFIFCQTNAPVKVHLGSSAVIILSFFNHKVLHSLNTKNNLYSFIRNFSCCTMDLLECLLANCVLEPHCPNHNHLHSRPTLFHTHYFASSAVPPGSLGLHLIVLSNVCCLCPHRTVGWLPQEHCVKKKELINVDRERCSGVLSS